MALAAVMLGFSSATQDIVIDAYRIESAEAELQAMMSATYIVGYRVAMLVAGAGSLYLADWFGSTSGGLPITPPGAIPTIMAAGDAGRHRHHAVDPRTRKRRGQDLSGVREQRRLRPLSAAVCRAVSGVHRQPCTPGRARLALVAAGEAGRWRKCSAMPACSRRSLVEIFCELTASLALAASPGCWRWLLVRPGLARSKWSNAPTCRAGARIFSAATAGHSRSGLLLALIGLYRISDIVLGVISNVFYQDLGFSKTEIADVVDAIFGILMTIAGGLLGGVLAARSHRRG